MQGMPQTVPQAHAISSSDIIDTRAIDLLVFKNVSVLFLEKKLKKQYLRNVIILNRQQQKNDTLKYKGLRLNSQG